jgi:hypothetical protein
MMNKVLTNGEGIKVPVYVISNSALSSDSIIPAWICKGNANGATMVLDRRTFTVDLTGFEDYIGIPEIEISVPGLRCHPQWKPAVDDNWEVTRPIPPPLPKMKVVGKIELPGKKDKTTKALQASEILFTFKMAGSREKGSSKPIAPTVSKDAVHLLK